MPLISSSHLRECRIVGERGRAWEMREMKYKGGREDLPGRQQLSKVESRRKAPCSAASMGQVVAAPANRTIPKIAFASGTTGGSTHRTQPTHNRPVSLGGRLHRRPSGGRSTTTAEDIERSWCEDGGAGGRNPRLFFFEEPQWWSVRPLWNRIEAEVTKSRSSNKRKKKKSRGLK